MFDDGCSLQAKSRHCATRCAWHATTSSCENLYRTRKLPAISGLLLHNAGNVPRRGLWGKTSRLYCRSRNDPFGENPSVHKVRKGRRFERMGADRNMIGSLGFDKLSSNVERNGRNCERAVSPVSFREIVSFESRLASRTTSATALQQGLELGFNLTRGGCRASLSPRRSNLRIHEPISSASVQFSWIDSQESPLKSFSTLSSQAQAFFPFWQSSGPALPPEGLGRNMHTMAGRISVLPEHCLRPQGFFLTTAPRRHAIVFLAISIATPLE